MFLPFFTAYTMRLLFLVLLGTLALSAAKPQYGNDNGGSDPTAPLTDAEASYNNPPETTQQEEAEKFEEVYGTDGAASQSNGGDNYDGSADNSGSDSSAPLTDGAGYQTANIVNNPPSPYHGGDDEDKDDDYDDAYDYEYVGENGSANPIQEAEGSCTDYAEQGYKCVDYYKCDDFGEIIEDGAGLIDIRY